MVDYFVAKESRLYIFDKLIVCHICAHDVLIPYESYRNVEKPGIQVIFIHYSSICQQCGFVIEFGDPSRFDAQQNKFLWALDQKLMEVEPIIESRMPQYNEDSIRAHKKCIWEALQLLIHHHGAPNLLQIMYQEERFLDIVRFFYPTYNSPENTISTMECLVKLLLLVRDNHIVELKEFNHVLQFGDYDELATFLKKHY